MNTYLDPDKVHQILSSFNINNLYHVNSLPTAVTFVSCDCILSRQFVEEKFLSQTPQKSDLKDKQLGIYNDLFFDPWDIHRRRRGRNFYGPVTFVFSKDALLSLKSPIQITKMNPIYWQFYHSRQDRYFESVADLQKTFVYGDFGYSIVIPNKTSLLLPENLKYILLDRPQIISKTGIHWDQYAAKKLSDEMRFPNSYRLISRQCPPLCKCRNEYDRWSLDRGRITLRNLEY